ncbi:MAG: TauD/TfdA family dioxygenase, partial [Spirochaetota bacterium]
MPIKVNLPKAGEVLLHDRWIRERCACSECVQDVTKQPLKHTPNSVVTNVKEESEKLTFSFSDGHSVSLAKEALESEFIDFSASCAVQSDFDTSVPERILWDKETFSLDEYSFEEMLHNNETRINILKSLLKYGLVLVSKTPRENNEVLRFSRELLGSVRETHWGIVFDVRAIPPKEGVAHDLAYSGEEIEFHVDNPYRTPCIDYQLLHCLESKGVVKG